MIQFMIYKSWLYISFSMFDMYKLEYVYKHLICFSCEAQNIFSCVSKSNLNFITKIDNP